MEKTVTTTFQLNARLSDFMKSAVSKREHLKESGKIDPVKRYVEDGIEDYLFALYTLTGIRLYTYKSFDPNGKLETLSITLVDNGKKRREKFTIWELNVVDQICNFFETFITDKMYWEAAEGNIAVLNEIMDDYNNVNRTIEYVVEDSNRDVAVLENNKIVFVVNPVDAVNFGSTWLAKRALLTEDSGIMFEVNRELKQLVSLYDEENIVDVMYKKIELHRLLGIRIMSRVKSIIAKCYSASDEKNGYRLDGNVLTAYRDGDLVFGKYDIEKKAFIA